MKSRILLLLLLICPYVFSNQNISTKNIFHFEVKGIDFERLKISAKIPKNYYLYRDKTFVTSRVKDLITNIKFSTINNKQILEDNFSIIVTISTDKLPSELILHYQGCSKTGSCYPPAAEAISIKATANMFNNRAPILDANFHENYSSISFFSQPRFLTMLTFFGLGLLLAFTPCILPMLPIITAMLQGSVKRFSWAQKIVITSAYVFGMALTFTFVGAFFALMGKNLQISMQQPLVNLSFSLLLIYIGFKLINYDNVLPLKMLQNKFNHLSSKLKNRGTISAAFCMGGVSSLILSPCASAPMIAVIGYISQTGDVIFGCLSLFSLALGMGVPLILTALSLSYYLPQNGWWNLLINYVLAVCLFVIAIFLLKKFFSLIFIFSGFLLLGLIILKYKYPFSFDKIIKTKKITALVIISFIFLYKITDISYNAPKNKSLKFQTITNVKQLEKILAANVGKIALIDVYAQWCRSCVNLEKKLLRNENIKQNLHDKLLLKIDLTHMNHDLNNLLEKYQIIAPPSFLFIDKCGQEAKGLRLIGSFSEQKFLQNLETLQN